MSGGSEDRRNSPGLPDRGDMGGGEHGAIRGTSIVRPGRVEGQGEGVDPALLILGVQDQPAVCILRHAISDRVPQLTTPRAVQGPSVL